MSILHSKQPIRTHKPSCPPFGAHDKYRSTAFKTVLRFVVAFAIKSKLETAQKKSPDSVIVKADSKFIQSLHLGVSSDLHVNNPLD